MALKALIEYNTVFQSNLPKETDIRISINGERLQVRLSKDADGNLVADDLDRYLIDGDIPLK